MALTRKQKLAGFGGHRVMELAKRGYASGASRSKSRRPAKRRTVSRKRTAKRTSSIPTVFKVALLAAGIVATAVLWKQFKAWQKINPGGNVQNWLAQVSVGGLDIGSKLAGLIPGVLAPLQNPLAGVGFGQYGSKITNPVQYLSPPPPQPTLPLGVPAVAPPVFNPVTGKEVTLESLSESQTQQYYVGQEVFPDRYVV